MCEFFSHKKGGQAKCGTTKIIPFTRHIFLGFIPPLNGRMMPSFFSAGADAGGDADDDELAGGAFPRFVKFEGGGIQETHPSFTLPKKGFGMGNRRAARGGGGKAIGHARN